MDWKHKWLKLGTGKVEYWELVMDGLALIAKIYPSKSGETFHIEMRFKRKLEQYISFTTLKSAQAFVKKWLDMECLKAAHAK